MTADDARLSVVVPCFNADEDLDRCLAALRRSGGENLDIIVVDDASTAGDPAPIAERHGARFRRLERNAGPAIARNQGVLDSESELILFIDADVVVHEDTVELARATLRDDETLGACFGSYDEAPGDPGFLSQYRNLYHRWVHQSGRREASTFWTGCGAVRRSAFLEAGGFSAALSRMGMEDIDLGYRLRDAGHRIALVKNMSCKHLKAWSLKGMVKTDIFHRGVPWMLLLLARNGESSDLNLNPRSRWATIAGGILPAATLAGLAWPPALVIAAVAALAIMMLQWGFLNYAAGLRGPGFAARCIPALWVFFFCCALSIPIALLRHFTGQGLAGRLAQPGAPPET